MIRNFKALGLAFVAIFAMSAVAASAASAHEFHSEGTPTIFSGGQTTTNVFETGNGAKVECSTATFQGTATGTEVDSVTVTPKYSGCTFLGEAATVTTNDCAYILDSDTNASGDAAVEVECAAGNTIEVNAAGLCTLKIGAQTVGGGVHYTNENSGSTRSVVVETTAKEIKYSKTGAFCFLVSGDGKYTGNVTVSGYVDNGNSGTSTTPNYSLGAQRGVWVE